MSSTFIKPLPLKLRCLYWRSLLSPHSLTCCYQSLPSSEMVELQQLQQYSTACYSCQSPLLRYSPVLLSHSRERLPAGLIVKAAVIKGSWRLVSSFYIYTSFSLQFPILVNYLNYLSYRSTDTDKFFFFSIY